MASVNTQLTKEDRLQKLKALNQRAEAQSRIDKAVTDETTTQERYKRYQDEFCECCLRALGDDYKDPTINTETVFAFLYYHAYHKKIPKDECVKRKRSVHKKTAATVVAGHSNPIDQGKLMDCNGQALSGNGGKIDEDEELENNVMIEQNVTTTY